MKYPTTTWSLWFAWYPVIANIPETDDYKWVIFRCVERKLCKSGGWESDVYIKYRLTTKKGATAPSTM